MCWQRTSTAAASASWKDRKDAITSLRCRRKLRCRSTNTAGGGGRARVAAASLKLVAGKQAAAAAWGMQGAVPHVRGAVVTGGHRTGPGRCAPVIIEMSTATLMRAASSPVVQPAQRTHQADLNCSELGAVGQGQRSSVPGVPPRLGVCGAVVRLPTSPRSAAISCARAVSFSAGNSSSAASASGAAGEGAGPAAPVLAVADPAAASISAVHYEGVNTSPPSGRRSAGMSPVSAFLLRDLNQ